MADRFVWLGACDLRNRLLYRGAYFPFQLTSKNKVQLSEVNRVFGPSILLGNELIVSDEGGFSMVSFEPGARIMLKSVSPPEGAVAVDNVPVPSLWDYWDALILFHIKAQRTPWCARATFVLTVAFYCIYGQTLRCLDELGCARWLFLIATGFPCLQLLNQLLSSLLCLPLLDTVPAQCTILLWLCTILYHFLYQRFHRRVSVDVSVITQEQEQEQERTPIQLSVP